MSTTQLFDTQAKRLIDDLKSVCANYGLGNDGNEFKIITQIFLYKFLNDKFAYEANTGSTSSSTASSTPSPTSSRATPSSTPPTAPRAAAACAGSTTSSPTRPSNSISPTSATSSRPRPTPPASSPEAFQQKLAGHQTRLQNLFQESKTLESEIETHLGKLQLEPEMENR